MPRLVKNLWQHVSDNLLVQAGLSPCRLSQPLNTHPHYFSLASRPPLSFIPCFPPWATTKFDKITIIPMTSAIKNAWDKLEKREAALDAISTLPEPTFQFWTDASVPNRITVLRLLSYTNLHLMQLPTTPNVDVQIDPFHPYDSVFSFQLVHSQMPESPNLKDYIWPFGLSYNFLKYFMVNHFSHCFWLVFMLISSCHRTLAPVQS